jgi:hypothetical protein
MRINELYADLFEDAVMSRGESRMPEGFKYTLPHTHAFPGMDNYYGFYRFVIAMAGHPENGDHPLQNELRDVPITVAYTKAEHDKIHDVARRMGVDPVEVAYNGSMEPPGTYTKSPVMRFSMPESSRRRMAGLIMLSEAMLHAAD